MSDPIRRLAGQISELRTRIDGLGSGPQLAFSSIEGGAIDEYDQDGNHVGTIGEQWDGTHGAFSLSGPPPPTPTAPTAAVDNVGVTLGWDGQFVNDAGELDIMITAPMDWSRAELHISQTKGFQADTTDTLVDAIESPRGGTRPVLPAPGIWYGVLVARSLSGKRSPQSAETQFEVLPGVTEADIQAIRDSFDGVATGLQKDLSDLATELGDATVRLDNAQDLLDDIPSQLATAKDEALAATAAFVKEALAKGQNLLPNGGFEDGITGWQDNAGGVVLAAAARSGSMGMRLDPSTGNVWPLSNMISTAGGRKYHAEMWVRRTGTDTWSTQSIGFVPQTRNPAGVYDTPVVHLFNADGTPLRAGDISSTTFTRVEAEFTVAQADAVELAIAPWFYSSPTNKYDVDDVALVDISAISLQVDKAKAEAIAAAAKDATEKAEAARVAAEKAADLNAKSKVDAALLAAASTATELANDASAAAIQAAALDAKNKADAAQEAASALARTAQTAAETAANAASSAAGIANGKAVVLFQSTAPAAEYRNVRTLWIDTTNNANTPKRWTTGTTWVAQTDKVAVDAAAKAAAAETAANNAATKAASAETAADNAMTAAGNLSQVYYSTANPTGIAPVNSTWRKVDAAKNVIGEWRYTGGNPAWQAQMVTTEMISNLDVGKLTAASGRFTQAVIDQLVADSAAFIKADIGNLTVTGTSKLSDLVAERVAGGIGSFLKLYASQVYIGDAGNIFPTDFNDDGWQTGNALISTSPTGGKTGGSSMLLGASTTQIGSYYGIDLNKRARAPRLIPGMTYYVKANVRSDKAIPVAAARAYIRLYNIASTSTAGYSWATPSAVDNAKAIAANTWGEIEGQFTVPEGHPDTVAIVGMYSQATATGSLRFSELTIQPVVTPALVVDGLVSGQNIIGAFIQTQAAANRGVKITDAGLFAYSSTGVETLRFDGANSIITGATVRTAASGARVQMSTAGLEAWGADNKKYLSATGSGLDLTGTIVASGDTSDTIGTVATVHTSRAIVGRRNAEPGIDLSPGFWLEVEANGVKLPNSVYPAGLRSTSPYTADGAVLQSAQLNGNSPYSNVSVSTGGVNLKSRFPYSNGYAAGGDLYLSREGDFALNGKDGFVNSGDTFAIMGTSRRNGVGVGELFLYARSVLNIEAPDVFINGERAGAIQHAEWTSTITLPTSTGASTVVNLLTADTARTQNNSFAVLASNRSTITLKKGLYAVSIRIDGGATLGASGRIAITNPGQTVTYLNQGIIAGEWDGQLTHPNLLAPANSFQICFPIRQSSGGNRTVKTTIMITKLA